MLEAGLLKVEKGGGRRIMKPYIDDKLCQELLNNHLEKYLYALTGV